MWASFSLREVSIKYDLSRGPMVFDLSISVLKSDIS